MKQVTTLTSGRGEVKLRRANDADKLFRFVSQLTILAVWKSFSSVGAPLAKFFAFYLWAGRVSFKVSSYVQRLVLRLIGWLSGSAFQRDSWARQWTRQFVSYDVKRWQISVALVVACTVVSHAVSKWRERFDARLQLIRRTKERMKQALTYGDWQELAHQLDKLGYDKTVDASGRMQEGRLYDKKLLTEKLEHLRRIRASGNIREMMFALRADLIRNVANVAKSQLHEIFYTIPNPVMQYITEIKEYLHLLKDWPEMGLPLEEKLNFFRETRHTFGRTALLLSGGGGLGSFHIGVVKALFENRCLPRVLAGSSVGSIVAAIVSTKTDAEMKEIYAKLDEFDLSFFNNSKAVQIVQHLINRGTCHDMDFLVSKLRQMLGDLTFLEAYERTGRILNVTVCPADTNEPPRLLNYLTAPNALIWSAVACSSAFPGLFAPYHLLARNANGEIVRFSAQGTSEALERRWRDGSLELDLPTFLLGEMFNCNHFIVSQTNPHIVPLLNLKKRMSRKWGSLLELELRHRCAQLQWILPDWIPTKWLSLFTQPWEGDITMILPHSLWHVGKALTNPTTEDLVKSVKIGEQTAWEKLSAIECNCAIEATLDSCLANITNKAREKPLGSLGSRIPSWLHMSHIGAPAVASWGALPTDSAPRVASWGENVDIADSVADFPRGGAGPVGRTAGDVSSEQMDADSVSDLVSRSDSSESSGDSVTPATYDCVDKTVQDLFSSFLPLAKSAAALETVGSEGQGLDCIAV